MRRLSIARNYCLLFAAGLLIAGNLHAASILYDVSSIGNTPEGNSIFRFTYTVSGVSFLTDRELSIEFNPALYRTLSNPVAPGGFDVIVFQPNDPAGTSGVYSAYSLVDLPSLSPFRVDAVYLGQGTPAGQPFSINQYNLSGDFRVIDSGMTASSVGGGSTVPEPGTFASVSLIVGLIGYSWTVRRRARRAGLN